MANITVAGYEIKIWKRGESEVFYPVNDFAGGNDLYIIEKLSYNENNLLVNIIEETSGGYKEVGSKSIKETILVYDKENHLIKETNKNSRGESSNLVTYKTDGNGRVIEQVINNYIFYTFKYDSHSNIIEASVKQGNIESSINYVYNSNSQLVSKTGNFLRSKHYNPILPLNNKGSLNPKSNSLITCNENGLIISSSSKASNGLSRLVYEYSFDETGKWINQIVRNRKSQTISYEIKREITYYD